VGDLTLCAFPACERQSCHVRRMCESWGVTITGQPSPDVADRERLLVVASTFPVPGALGVPPFVGTLTSELTSQFDVRVLTIMRGPRGGCRASLENNAELIAIGRRRAGPIRVGLLAEWSSAGQRYRELFLLLRWFIAIIRECQRFRPHVIHIHWGFPVPPLLRTARLLRLIPRVRYVVSMHGSDVQLLATRWRRLIRFGLVGASSVTCVNSVQLKALETLGTKHLRPTLLPMPIEPSFFARHRIDRTSPAQALRVLFVGRLVEGKGLEKLLSAHAIVGASHDVVLTVVGDGPLMDNARSEHPDVEFKGSRASAEVSELMQNTSLVVLPFDGPEGLPVTVLEAMASEVPIVVTRTVGITDLEALGAKFFSLHPEASHLDLAAVMRDALSAITRSPAEVRTMTAANLKLAKRFSSGVLGERARQILSKGVTDGQP